MDLRNAPFLGIQLLKPERNCLRLLRLKQPSMQHNFFPGSEIR